MKTSIRKLDRWEDPDGVVYEEHTVVLEPYCKNMEELAEKLELSVSQVYRLLKNPTRRFTMNEMRELHKQLNWKKRDSWDDVIRVPLTDTHTLIQIAVEEMQTKEEESEAKSKRSVLSGVLEATEKEKVRAGRPTRFSEGLVQSAALAEWKESMNTTARTMKQFSERIKKQDEMIARLMDLAASQQELVEKLVARNEDLKKSA